MQGWRGNASALQADSYWGCEVTSGDTNNVAHIDLTGRRSVEWGDNDIGVLAIAA